MHDLEAIQFVLLDRLQHDALASAIIPLKIEAFEDVPWSVDGKVRIRIPRRGDRNALRLPFFNAPPEPGKMMPGERESEADVFGEGENATVKCHEPSGGAKPALHVHHAVGDTGDVERCDMKDIHTLR
jgi:hypothetical protein